MNLKSKSQVFKNIDVLLVAYVLIAVLGSLGQYLKGGGVVDGHKYTDYNNFLIFKFSFER